MALIPIPRGKTVEIHYGGNNVLGTAGVGGKLVLDEDITLSLQTNYTPLVGQIPAVAQATGALEKLGTYATAALGLFGDNNEITFKYAQSTIPVWQNTEPLRFICTVSFYADTNAANNSFSPDGLENVYLPLMKLCQLPLPYEKSSSLGKITGLKSPIGNIAKTIKEGFSNFDYRTAQAGLLSIRIGDVLYLPSIIIERAEPIFASDSIGHIGPIVDRNNKVSYRDYYPLHGKLQLTIRTLISATRNLIVDAAKKLHRGQIELSVITPANVREEDTPS